MKRITALLLSSQVALSCFSQWNSNPPPVIQNLNDVWVTEADRIITAGDGGLIFYSDNCGESWTLALNPVAGDDVKGLHFVSPLTGFASGENGRTLKTTDGGATWTFFQSPAGNDLEDIFFVNETVGYAAGRDGNIVKSTNGGVTWTSQISGTLERLESIWFLDEDNGFVAGRGSTLLKTTNGGSTWIPQATGIPGDLYGIQFIDAMNAFVASEFGIYHSTDGGSNWTNAGAAITQWNDVHFISSTEGYACGIFGQLISTSNGGVSWQTETTGSTAEFLALHLNSGGVGYVCGELGAGYSRCITEVCFGDFNADLVINTQDLLIMLASFGCLSSCGIVDLNSDGIVNTTDLLSFLSVFGSSCT